MRQTWERAHWRRSARTWISIARMARNRNDQEQYRKALQHFRDARNEGRN